jgi:2-polyprenyl-3-methyl-5-hydroxy-6-metoxy-1,4-benzoquinol methylase
MIDKIMENYNLSNFDILKFIPSGISDLKLSKEECKSLKYKNSLCAVIDGKKYLEIGNTNILNAISFFQANPEAELTSIKYVSNLNNYYFDDWSIEYLKSFNYKSFSSNYKTINDLNDQFFDLVNLDTITQSEKFYQTLIDSSKITKWLLISNCTNNINLHYELIHFLHVYRDIIDFYFNINEFNDQILIKINYNKRNLINKKINDSRGLKTLYDSSYYLNYCGGCDSFNEDGGANSSDPRILNTLSLIFLHPKGGKLLDLGCGRGEVVLQAALHGFDCTGIDYSQDAICIAKKETNSLPALRNKIKYVVSDISDYIPTEKHDVVVASDVIEHMSHDEVSKCFEMVSCTLSEDGFFIIHTFPNAWYYNYNHAKNRRKILSLGGFLPADPRSRFEKSMHINEQNPRVLLKQLKEFFPHVLVWFNSPDDPAGSLVGENGHQRLAEYRDLMAFASNNPIDINQIKDTLSLYRWNKGDIRQLTIEITQCPKEVHCLKLFDVQIELGNFSQYTIHSLLPHPINLSYHWVDCSSNDTLVFDGLRTSICNPVRPGSVRTLLARCRAPQKVGEYKLRFSLVQERHAWFDQPPFQMFTDKIVKIFK